MLNVGKQSLSKGIRIGCASGFWGDTATSVTHLVQGGKLDFLVFDYLSEITMSLLSSAMQKNPELGYTPDFVAYAMAPNLKEIKQQGIKVVTNAGGMNPNSCAAALKNVSRKSGLDFNIAVVNGDNLMPQLTTMQNMGLKDMKSGSQFPKAVNSMNAYLGAGPIAQSLKDGAEIVITGRCVDSALALGPLINTFNWSLADFDKLAAGSLVGHLIECGAQSTGGIHTDWHLVPDWHKMGFPVAECYENGTFTLSKPPNTGGIVTRGTVAEQLLYEIDDPNNYALPDVLCDFANVKISEVGENTVFIEGAKGKKPSDSYKVSSTYSDGYRATSLYPVVGYKAIEKGRRTAESIIKRSEMIFEKLGLPKFRRTHIEILGAGANYGEKSKETSQAREVVIWVAVHHDTKEAVQIFSREIAAAATGAAPGLTTLVGGRPKASPILRLFSFLYPKDKVKVEVTSNDGTTKEYVPDVDITKLDSIEKHSIKEADVYSNLMTGSFSYHLRELAFTRSGDKGDTVNIGVISRHPSYLPYITKFITADVVAKYFEHLFTDDTKPVVKRYFMPGLDAFNFVLENALGGGGVASLRSDPQGKGCAQVLCDFVMKDMPHLDVLQKEWANKDRSTA